MRPIRILGIAPYEGMRNLMVSIAADMPDVALTAFVGDLEPGVAIASQYTSEDFDVILSRGGTAELIRSHSTLPVVEIELSVYDILRAMKLAEGSSSSYAVVGFPAITRNAAFLCEVLRYNIDLYTIHNTAEARKVLQTLADEGCGMVLCDMVTNSLAREYALPAMLITSGTESISAAIRNAVHMSLSFLHLQERIRLLENLLECREDCTLAYDAEGQVCFRHLKEELPAAVVDKACSAVPSVLADGRRRLTCMAGKKMYILKGQRMVSAGEHFAVFTIAETPVNQPLEKYGIRVFDREEAFDHFFNSFYGITQPSAMSKLVNEFAESRQPLMVVGELGTGKDQMIRLLYGKSRFSTSPLYIIDCAMLKGKGWSFLTESETSPLFDQGVTLHFRSLSILSDAQFHQLFETVRELHVAQRNRLLFSCTMDENGQLPPWAKKLMSWFSTLTMSMPPLRSHKEDIPHLASLYVSILNMRHAREVAGFEPDALSHLCAYNWPANYDQFKRLLQELVLMTETPYISASDVDRLLAREERFFRQETPKVATPPALQGKTMEELELEIIQQVMDEEGGNQTAVAARLGLSRTTLWRMLKKSSNT